MGHAEPIATQPIQDLFPLMIVSVDLVISERKETARPVPLPATVPAVQKNTPVVPIVTRQVYEQLHFKIAIVSQDII